MYRPTKEEFIELAKNGNLIPVSKEIVADLETPVSAYKKIEGEYSFLLESVEQGENIARYSFLGTGTKDNLHTPQKLDELKAEMKKYKPVVVADLPPFHGGLVGYLSYDVVREIENIPDKNPDDLKAPLMMFLLTDTLLAFDHVKRKILVISNAYVKGDPGQAYDEAVKKIEAIEKKLKKDIKLKTIDISKPARPSNIESNMSKDEYMQAVEKAKEHIRAGDIIQCVPSQRLETACKKDTFDVYRVLRMINPSPYMFYLKYGRMILAGSSPEVMVTLMGDEAVIRPIAGTRPRGKDKASDQAFEKELLASEKEKAEHLMLVDLGRNDLGRVCEYGSVETNELMVIERYSHVMHIASNVRGKLRKDKDAFDLVKASFPAGTVSGAPKVRAMEIIDELEKTRRGPYAGAVGYFDFAGNTDTCITIRTILFKDNKAYVQVGAGIVADSDPAAEYEETRNKAMGMLKAIELA
ncbi:MAG: anthranilate synthase component I [Candidatus Margulisiibacteriota bacterium]